MPRKGCQGLGLVLPQLEGEALDVGLGQHRPRAQPVLGRVAACEWWYLG